MSDAPKVVQTPFIPKEGGFVGDESSDQIAINARKDQAAERLADEDFGRQIVADRVIREIRESREAQTKQAVEAEKKKWHQDLAEKRTIESIIAAKGASADVVSKLSAMTPAEIALRPALIKAIKQDLELALSLL